MDLSAAIDRTNLACSNTKKFQYANQQILTFFFFYTQYLFVQSVFLLFVCKIIDFPKTLFFLRHNNIWDATYELCMTAHFSALQRCVLWP